MATKSTKNQLTRFIIVGISNVVVDLLVYKLLMIWLSISLAKGMSFLCGTLYAYHCNRVWTFRVRHADQKQALRFFAVYGTNLAFNVGANALTLSILPMAFSFRINLAYVVATGVSAALNFFGMKWFVFRERPTLEQVKYHKQQPPN